MQSHAAMGDRRLLLVEDDGELRSSLAELLRSDGYLVTGACNGSEALEYLRRPPLPDLILLDLMMPIKDGWQFRIEQKRDPSIAAIPVLAMSADDTPKAEAIDADDYIKKPFQYETLLGAIQRVIEEKRLAHLDRMASLGTLAAGITHEINNPLTYVIANLQLLEEELPRLTQDYFDTFQTVSADTPAQSPPAFGRLREMGARLHDALEGAERIRGIVQHVKMFSRAGDEHRTYFDLRSVLDSSIKVVMTEIRRRARLVKEYGHIPLVFANPGQLGQVFLNLLLNAAHAIEHDDPGKNVIRVTTKTGEGGEIIVEICDTGVGIPPEIRHRIFDPFFTTKPLGIGTGLGLSICHGIVRSLSGSIAVESDVGVGTTFRVTLPPPDPGKVAAAETPKPKPLMARGRILIIDDEPKVAQALKDMIGEGHDTTIATSGTNALALLLREPEDKRFDVILCDLHMPDVTGMDLYERVSRKKPHVAERMVFMTGGTFSERSREFAARVKSPRLDKPIDRAELQRIVAAAVTRRAS